MSGKNIPSTNQGVFEDDPCVNEKLSKLALLTDGNRLLVGWSKSRRLVS